MASKALVVGVGVGAAVAATAISTLAQPQRQTAAVYPPEGRQEVRIGCCLPAYSYASFSFRDFMTMPPDDAVVITPLSGVVHSVVFSGTAAFELALKDGTGKTLVYLEEYQGSSTNVIIDATFTDGLYLTSWDGKRPYASSVTVFYALNQ